MEVAESLTLITPIIGTPERVNIHRSVNYQEGIKTALFLLETSFVPNQGMIPRVLNHDRIIKTQAFSEG
jgi:hypothetical protein